MKKDTKMPENITTQLDLKQIKKDEESNLNLFNSRIPDVSTPSQLECCIFNYGNRAIFLLEKIIEELREIKKNTFPGH
jgi:hypothetical protein